MLEMLRGNGAKAKLENPWLNSRRAWNSHVGYIVASRRIWQAVALMALMITLAAVGGLITVATRSRFVPYVIEVDGIGQTFAVRAADRPGEADSRVVHASLAQWIRDARFVSFDLAAQNAAIWRVFALLRTADPATAKMTRHMQEDATNPMKRSKEMSVGVEIESALQQTPATWQLIWTERVYSRTGELIETGKMRALITVYTSPHPVFTTEEEIRANPLGIYVRDYDWSRIIEPK